MLRNEVSKHFGVNIKTVRSYENEDLTAKTNRLGNGYLQAQANDCHQAKEIVDKNLILIDQKINDLKTLKKQLQVLSDSCHEISAGKDCEIVKTLTKASEGEECVCHAPKTQKSRANL